MEADGGHLSDGAPAQLSTPGRICILPAHAPLLAGTCDRLGLRLRGRVARSPVGRDGRWGSAPQHFGDGPGQRTRRIARHAVPDLRLGNHNRGEMSEGEQPP